MKSATLVTAAILLSAASADVRAEQGASDPEPSARTVGEEVSAGGRANPVCGFWKDIQESVEAGWRSLDAGSYPFRIAFSDEPEKLIPDFQQATERWAEISEQVSARERHCAELASSSDSRTTARERKDAARVFLVADPEPDSSTVVDPAK